MLIEGFPISNEDFWIRDAKLVNIMQIFQNNKKTHKKPKSKTLQVPTIFNKGYSTCNTMGANLPHS